MFVVETVDGLTGSQDNVSSRDIIYTVPSVIDVEINSAKYVYTMQSPTTVRISPAPSDDMTIRIRYVATSTLTLHQTLWNYASQVKRSYTMPCTLSICLATLQNHFKWVAVV